MKYFLRLDTIGEAPLIEIDEEAYLAYKQAVTILSNCLDIEEKYEILILGYLEFERQILELATQNMVRRDLGYPRFFQIRLLMNARLAHLLTSARSYIEQLHRHAKRCAPSRDDVKQTVKGFFSAEYDSCLEYMFMEALRNHVQHHGLAVHQTALPSRWTEVGNNGLIEFGLEITSLRSEFEANNEFKKEVLHLLPNTVDLIRATRRYIECLSNVHEKTRELIAEPVAQARHRIEDAQQQYAKFHEGSLLGLSAFKLSDSGNDKVLLLLEWDNIRIELQQKNKRLINLHKRVVTNKLNIIGA